MKFIDNLPQLWKMWSVRILAVLFFVGSSWDSIPDNVKAMIPPKYLGYILAVVAFCGIVARAIKQFDGDTSTDQQK